MTKRVALIKDGKVFDVIIAGHDFKPPKGSIHVETETANIGDAHDGHSFLGLEPLKKEQLISCAMMHKHSLIERLRLDFDLANHGDEPKPTQFLIHDKLRRDIQDIEFLGADATLVFGDKAIKLTAHQIQKLRELISLEVANIYNVLGTVIQAIKDGKITTFEEISAPEMWRRLS